MFVDGPNPTQVQFTPPHKRVNPPPPLVLIHDGGGTTFSYFILGDLHREVWAIHDPRHWNSTPWEGGIDEMAHHYIDLMQAEGISGTILLGGWSLGGYLSLAIARMLADDVSSNITVAGFLIIDSPYHIPWSRIGPPPTAFGSSELILGDFPDLVRKSFRNCHSLLADWQLPEWNAPVCGGKKVKIDVAGRSFSLEQGAVLYKPVEGEWQTIKTRMYQHVEHPVEPRSPPPAVMIRCTQSVMIKRGPNSADRFRTEKLLGWEGKYPDFIKATIDIDATHTDVFDQYDQVKTKNLTAQLNEGLDILDGLWASSKLEGMKTVL